MTCFNLRSMLGALVILLCAFLTACGTAYNLTLSATSSRAQPCTATGTSSVITAAITQSR